MTLEEAIAEAKKRWGKTGIALTTEGAPRTRLAGVATYWVGVIDPPSGVFSEHGWSATSFEDAFTQVQPKSATASPVADYDEHIATSKAFLLVAETSRILREAIDEKRHFSFSIDAGSRALPPKLGNNGQLHECGEHDGSCYIVIRIEPR